MDWALRQLQEIAKERGLKLNAEPHWIEKDGLIRIAVESDAGRRILPLSRADVDDVQGDTNAGLFSPIETLKAEIDEFVTDCLGRAATSERRRAYNALPGAEKKRIAEMKVFSSFAQTAQLAIDSVTVHSEEPPKPDIFCKIDGRDYYFELGEVTDCELAGQLGQASKTMEPAPGPFSQEEPFAYMLQEKTKKTYETGGVPVDLVLYFDKQYPMIEGIREHVAKYATELGLLVSSGPFERVWIYSHCDGGVVLWQSS